MSKKIYAVVTSKIRDYRPGYDVTTESETDAVAYAYHLGTESTLETDSENADIPIPVVFNKVISIGSIKNSVDVSEGGGIRDYGNCTVEFVSNVDVSKGQYIEIVYDDDIKQHPLYIGIIDSIATDSKKLTVNCIAPVGSNVPSIYYENAYIFTNDFNFEGVGSYLSTETTTVIPQSCRYRNGPYELVPAFNLDLFTGTSTDILVPTISNGSLDIELDELDVLNEYSDTVTSYPYKLKYTMRAISTIGMPIDGAWSGTATPSEIERDDDQANLVRFYNVIGVDMFEYLRDTYYNNDDSDALNGIVDKISDREYMIGVDATGSIQKVIKIRVGNTIYRAIDVTFNYSYANVDTSTDIYASETLGLLDAKINGEGGVDLYVSVDIPASEIDMDLTYMFTTTRHDSTHIGFNIDKNTDTTSYFGHCKNILNITADGYIENYSDGYIYEYGYDILTTNTLPKNNDITTDFSVVTVDQLGYVLQDGTYQRIQDSGIPTNNRSVVEFENDDSDEDYLVMGKYTTLDDDYDPVANRQLMSFELDVESNINLFRNTENLENLNFNFEMDLYADSRAESETYDYDEFYTYFLTSSAGELPSTRVELEMTLITGEEITLVSYTSKTGDYLTYRTSIDEPYPPRASTHLIYRISSRPTSHLTNIKLNRDNWTVESTTISQIQDWEISSVNMKVFFTASISYYSDDPIISPTVTPKIKLKTLSYNTFYDITAEEYDYADYINSLTRLGGPSVGIETYTLGDDHDFTTDFGWSFERFVQYALDPRLENELVIGYPRDNINYPLSDIGIHSVVTRRIYESYEDEIENVKNVEHLDEFLNDSHLLLTSAATDLNPITDIYGNRIGLRRRNLNLFDLIDPITPRYIFDNIVIGSVGNDVISGLGYKTFSMTVTDLFTMTYVDSDTVTIDYIYTIEDNYDITRTDLPEFFALIDSLSSDELATESNHYDMILPSVTINRDIDDGKLDINKILVYAARLMSVNNFDRNRYSFEISLDEYNSVADTYTPDLNRLPQLGDTVTLQDGYYGTTTSPIFGMLTSIAISDIESNIVTIEMVESVSIGSVLANFTLDTFSGTEPLSVRFENLSYGEDLTYSWEENINLSGWTEFSTLTNPTRVYSDDGDTISIRLTATDGDLSSTKTMTNIIQVGDSFLLSADFSVDKIKGDAPLEVTFTDQSSGAPISWEWKISGLVFSTAQNPVYVINPYEGQDYDITLTVTNADGDTSTKTYLSLIDVDTYSLETNMDNTNLSTNEE